VRISFH